MRLMPDPPRTALSHYHSVPLAKMKVAVYSSKDYDKKFLTLANEAQAPEHRYVRFVCDSTDGIPPELRHYVAHNEVEDKEKG